MTQGAASWPGIGLQPPALARRALHELGGITVLLEAARGAHEHFL